MKNVSFTPPPEFYSRGKLVSKSVSNLKVQKICTFIIVLLSVILVNYDDVFSQGCEGEDCPGQYYVLDSIVITIPGYPTCNATVYYQKIWCNIPPNSAAAQIKVLDMKLFLDGCQSLKDIIFPYGESNPPNEMALKSLWRSISIEVSKEEYKQYINNLSPYERERHYCHTSEFLSTRITLIEGYCLRSCIGIYTSLTGLQAGYYHVNYISCDDYACCMLTSYFCYDLANEKSYYWGTQVQAFHSSVCNSNSTPQGNCIFFIIPGYHLSIQSTGCNSSCQDGWFNE